VQNIIIATYYHHQVVIYAAIATRLPKFINLAPAPARSFSLVTDPPSLLDILLQSRRLQKLVSSSCRPVAIAVIRTDDNIMSFSSGTAFVVFPAPLISITTSLPTLSLVAMMNRLKMEVMSPQAAPPPR
jgi:hypothetical protein